MFVSRGASGKGSIINRLDGVPSWTKARVLGLSKIVAWAHGIEDDHRTISPDFGVLNNGIYQAISIRESLP